MLAPCVEPCRDRMTSGCERLLPGETDAMDSCTGVLGQIIVAERLGRMVGDYGRRLSQTLKTQRDIKVISDGRPLRAAIPDRRVEPRKNRFIWSADERLDSGMGTDHVPAVEVGDLYRPVRACETHTAVKCSLALKPASRVFAGGASPHVAGRQVKHAGPAEQCEQPALRMKRLDVLKREVVRLIADARDRPRDIDAAGIKNEGRVSEQPYRPHQSYRNHFEGRPAGRQVIVYAAVAQDARVGRVQAVSAPGIGPTGRAECP